MKIVPAFPEAAQVAAVCEYYKGVIVGHANIASSRQMHLLNLHQLVKKHAVGKIDTPSFVKLVAELADTAAAIRPYNLDPLGGPKLTLFKMENT